MQTLIADLVYSFRMWRRNPASSLAVVLVLALGIAGNTAMFSAFHAWILRPLDLAKPEELVTIYNTRPRDGEFSFSISGEDAADWRQRPAIAEIALFDRHDFNYQEDAFAERLAGVKIDARLLPLLGRYPVLGNAFSAADDLPGRPASRVLISDSLWRDRFAAAPSVLGRTIRLDGVAHEIIGVMPRGFAFPEWAELWTPLGASEIGPEGASRRYDNVARLASGKTVEQVEANLQAWAAERALATPDTHRDWSVRVEPLREKWVPPVIRTALSASLGAAFFALLVICANVAGLLLAQAASRRREMALRSALGASRRRLARQTLTETAGLGLMGAVVGVPLAVLFNRWMLSLAPLDPPYLFTMRIDPRAIVYTGLVAIAAGMVAGVAPMLRHRTAEPAEVLQGGGRTTPGGAGRWTGSVLVAAELALSTALVIASLLMVKSFLQQNAADPGFRADGVLTLGVSLRGEEFEDPERRVEFADRAASRLLALPGVMSVSGVSVLPTSNGSIVSIFPGGAVEGEAEPLRANYRRVDSAYFDLIELPISEGRGFHDSEDDTVRPLILSRSAASRLWRAESPIGRLVRFAGSDREARVVGVVGDIDVGAEMVSAGTPRGLDVYESWQVAPSPEFVFVVRTEENVDTLAPLARATLNEVDGAVPVGEVMSMEEALRQRFWTTSFFSRVLSLYALLAVLVALVGAYGIAAEGVSRRKREIAIRAALGAERRRILFALMRGAAIACAIGIGLGLAAALALTRIGAGMLVDVDARDPTVFGGVALLLAAVALVAIWLPARRSTRIDPAIVLRSES